MDARSEVIATLLEIDSNKSHLEQLLDQVRSPVGVVPFVGAGLSKPLDFPTWSGFLLDQARRAGQHSAVKGALDDGRFEQAAQVISDTLGRGLFLEAIRDTFGRPVNPAQVCGPVSLLPDLPNVGPVVTTNVDRVLEASFAYAQRPFARHVYGFQSDPIAEALGARRHYLIMLHGDALDTDHCVFTQDDYDREYGAARGVTTVRDCLAAIFRNGPLLFLGCSLSCDRTVQVLKDVASPGTPYHWAIVQQPTEGFAARRQELAELHIRPIWYPQGRHECVEHVLRYLLAELGPRIEPRPAGDAFRRDNLPPFDGELVGRRQERERVRWALSSKSQLVSIEGMSGIGKTTLAIHMGREGLPKPGATARAKAKAFEAVVWISASTGNKPAGNDWLNEALNTVAAVWGKGNIDQVARDRKESEVSALLSRHRTLVIVDSFDAIDDERLGDWLLHIPAPSKALITTSVTPVRWLHLRNLVRVHVEALDEKESADLIRQEARRLDLPRIAEADPSLIEPLAAAASGNALVIMWTLPHIALGEFSLDDAVQLLQTAGPGAREVFDRLFSSHWERMADNARRVLLAVPLFSETASREALGAASGLDRAPLQDGVVELVKRHLLTACEDQGLGSCKRFMAHPLTRAFARAKLDAAPSREEKMRRQISHHFHRLVARTIAGDAPPREPYWHVLAQRDYEELDTDWPNIRRVLLWADAERRDEDLVEFMQLLVHYMNRRMLYSDRAYFADHAALAARRLDRPAAEAWFRIDALGWVFIEQGHLDAAEREIVHGLQIGKSLSLDDPRYTDVSALGNAFLAYVLHLRAEALRAGTTVSQERESLRTAELCDAEADRAIELAVQLKPDCMPLVACRIGMVQGLVARAHGDLGLAIRCYEETVEVAEREMDVDFVANLRYRLGSLHLEEGQQSKGREPILAARDQFERVLAAEERRDNLMAIYAEFGLARVAQMEGNPATAAELATRARAALVGHRVDTHRLLPELDAFLRTLQAAVPAHPRLAG